MRIMDMDEDDLREWIRKRLTDISVDVVTVARKDIEFAINKADNQLKKLVGEIEQASDISLRATDALDIIAKGGKIIVENCTISHSEHNAHIDLRIGGFSALQDFEKNRIDLAKDHKYRVILIIEPLE